MPTAQVVRWWYSDRSPGGVCVELALPTGERNTYFIDSATAERHRLAIGSELSEEAYADVELLSRTFEYLRRLRRFLAHRLRSSSEVAQRLRQLGATGDVIERAVAYLQQQGIIDDVRFATAMVRDAVRLRSLSASMIRRQLLAKGISPEIADAVIAHEYPHAEEFNRACAAARKALRRLASSSEPQRTRRLRDYLLRRGFAPSTIKRVLATLMESQSETSQ